jgi:hypothetical protein
LHNLLLGEAEGIGTADGTLAVSGDISDFQHVSVGRTRLNSIGDALGSLSAGGTVTGVGTGNFTVAAAGAAGNTIGNAVIGTGLNDFNLVGVGLAGTDATGTATGNLIVQSGGVHSGGSGFALDIGSTNGDADVTATADVAGGVSGYGIVAVGVSRAIGASTGNANGELIVHDGGLSGTGMGGTSNYLRVGAADGPGSAQGTVEVTGGITGLPAIEIGVTHTGSSGNAQGALALHGGHSAANDMEVGVNHGTGSASGTVSIDHGLFDLSNSLTMGAGGGLMFHIDGFMRGIDYGAFDVGNALLDGTTSAPVRISTPACSAAFFNATIRA